MLDELTSPSTREVFEAQENVRSGGSRSKRSILACDKYAFLAEPLASIAKAKLGDPGYLVKGLIPSSGLHVLYGAPGLGKSFLALDLALHVAAGKKWAGRKVNPEGSGVVYVAAEGSRAFRRRIQVAMKERGINDKASFLLVTKAPNLAERQKLDAFVDEIQEQCAARKITPRLIILDTLARSTLGLDESSSRDMGLFVENAAKLSLAFDEAVIMPVHHTGKDVERGMRGSSALNGAADAVWQLRLDDRGLNFYVEKMKDGPSGFTVRFSLHQVSCGLDRDNEEITTQVVAFPQDPVSKEAPPIKAKRTTSVDAALALLAEAIRSSGRTAKDGAPSNAGRAKAILAEELYKIIIPQLMGGKGYKDEKSAKMVFQRSLRSLVEKDKLCAENNWFWLSADTGLDVPF